MDVARTTPIMAERCIANELGVLGVLGERISVTEAVAGVVDVEAEGDVALLSCECDCDCWNAEGVSTLFLGDEGAVN